MISNEFYCTEISDWDRKEIFNFLGHSEGINKIHYYAPDVVNVLQIIAPVLSQINKKFTSQDENEDDGQDEEDLMLDIQGSFLFIISWFNNYY